MGWRSSVASCCGQASTILRNARKTHRPAHLRRCTRDPLDRLLALLGNRPILGYAIAFDRAVPDRLVEARHGFRLPNRSIELRDVYRDAWRLAHPEQTEPDQRYESVMAAAGAPVLGRHTALGDAVTTALAWVRFTRGGL